MTGWDLKAFIAGNYLDEYKTMMYLRDVNCISDNCVLPEEVADADAQIAFSWMQYYKRRINERKAIPGTAWSPKSKQGFKKPVTRRI